MRPSQLMEIMLALLPPREPDGMLFKTHFLNRLPVDIRIPQPRGGSRVQDCETFLLVEICQFRKHVYSAFSRASQTFNFIYFFKRYYCLC